MSVLRLTGNSFSIESVIGPEDYWMTSWGPHPLGVLEEAGVDVDRCAACGQKLAWRFIVVNDLDDRYVVGSKCAANACEIEAHRIEAKRKSGLREWARRQLRNEDLIEFLKAEPHPKGWTRRTRLDDVRYWTGKADYRALRAALKDLKGGRALRHPYDAEVGERVEFRVEVRVDINGKKRKVEGFGEVLGFGRKRGTKTIKIAPTFEVPPGQSLSVVKTLVDKRLRDEGAFPSNVRREGADWKGREVLGGSR